MSDEKQTDLMTIESVETEVAPRNPTDLLIELAIQHGADVDKLERLIALKNAEDARLSKREFDRHFAEMQADFTPAPRSKQGDKAKYAPLDVLQKHYGPVIADHGFSYRFSEEPLPEGGIRVKLAISGYGHAENTYKDLPKYVPDTGSSSGKSIMNVLQAEGTRQTYGQRYALIAGFGLIVEDEDTDGKADIETTLDCAEELKALGECKNADDLLSVAAAIIKPIAKGSPKRKLLEGVYRKRRKELIP